MNAIALSFNDVSFDVVDRNNQPWLRSPQIGDALGYKKGRVSIDKIYKANADEFTDSMTALVELDTNGGKQQVRIFSLRGCHLLAMFARTAIAKQFRKWVLDILEQHTQPQSIPEPPTITKAQQGELFNIVEAIAGPDGKIRAAVWSRFHRKFNVSKYYYTPAERFEDAKAYLELKLQEYNAGVRWHWLDDNEIQSLVDEKMKALQGELLTKEQPETKSLTLQDIDELITRKLSAVIGEPKMELEEPINWSTVIPMRFRYHIELSKIEKALNAFGYKIARQVPEQNKPFELPEMTTFLNTRPIVSAVQDK